MTITTTKHRPQSTKWPTLETPHSTCDNNCYTSSHSRKHDNPRANSDSSDAIAVSKPVPPERTFAGGHSRKCNDPRSHSGASYTLPVSKLIPQQKQTVTDDSDLPTNLDFDVNPDYVCPSWMDISDTEAPLHGDEGYDSGRDHDTDTNVDDWDAQANGMHVDYNHGIDSAEASQDIDGGPDLNQDYDASDDSGDGKISHVCVHHTTKLPAWLTI